jgi:hypothetical protein
VERHVCYWRTACTALREGNQSYRDATASIQTLLAQPGRVFDIEPGTTEAQVYAPRVAYRGADLASVLYYLNETQSPLLDKIIEIVAEAITGFAGFEFNHVGSDRIGFAARFIDKRGSVVAPNLADGCLSMIGLVTLALTATKPSVLCIEEPENGLTRVDPSAETTS